MEKIIIKNGIIYDPINNIGGEQQDILIEEGKIVEKFSNQNDIYEIDAKEKTVVPAGIDVHSHFASQQVNWARLIGSKYPDFQKVWNGLTLDFITREYLSNGYTFIVDANVYPSTVSQAIFNLKQMPVIDKAFLLNISNLWPMELEFQREMLNEGSGFLSDILKKTKSFGIKVYNPFEREEWNFKKIRSDLNQKGRLYNFSAKDVYTNVVKYVEHLKLPHSTHAHIEGYEDEQAKHNLNDLLGAIKDLGIKPPTSNEKLFVRTQIFHLAHASSYNIDGNNSDLIQFYNNNPEFDLDIGFIGFDPINPVISGDRRLMNALTEKNNSYKIIRNAVEMEGDSFSSLRSLSKRDEIYSTLWANSLALSLGIKNKWQLQFTTNYPNYSSASNFPKIATWLLSSKARDSFTTELNPTIKERIEALNDKKLTFNEFIIITRSSPAKSLGIGHIKGNLGFGADADLNIINVNPKKIDIEHQPEELKKALSSIEIVIKNGRIIKKNQKLSLESNGKIFWSNGSEEIKIEQFTLNKKKQFYEKFYSTFYDNNKIQSDKSIFRRIS